jgi:plasmid replication initiation protein
MKSALELTPNDGEMLKPKELIEVRGVGTFTLEDRRIYNALVHNAWGAKLGEAGHLFEIETGPLRAIVGDNQRLKKSLRKLQTTLVETNDGERWRSVQLLGSVEISTTSNRGVLTYSFSPMLALLLKDSTIFAKLDLEVMRSFRSKFAFSLYEAISRRIRMRSFMEDLTIEGLRELLGVETGKLTTYSNLNKFAIQPAIDEVNAITPYTVSIVHKKKGRKVVSFIMGWSTKDENGLKEAYVEMNRHSTGRRSRIDNDVEQLNVGEQQ